MSTESRLKIMDKHKIDMQVLTPPQRLCRIAKSDENTEFCRKVNDYFYELSEEYPQKFIGFPATSPSSKPKMIFIGHYNLIN